MDPVRTINLIQTKQQEESPQMGIVIAFSRRLSLWALTIFIVSGIVIGGMYYYLKVRYDQLVATRQELTQNITQNATKEGLLASVKQRTALITKIFGVQQPVGNVFDLLTSFLSPGQMSDVSIDEKNNVSFTIHTASIDDVISVTDTLIKQTTEHHIKAPQLTSLTLAKTGGFDVGLSFIAVF
jgi:hypothetical protein